MVLLESIFSGFWATNLVLAACELGQRFSDTFCEIEYSIADLHWYFLPINIQRMLPTITVYAQEPFVVNFFGSVVCCRDQFKKVRLSLNALDKLLVIIEFFLGHQYRI